jgi:hypothetical protein
MLLWRGCAYELPVGRDCLRSEQSRPLAVARSGASEQHACVIILRVRQPWLGADALVRRDRIVEMTLGVVPALDRRREEPEVTGDRARGDLRIGHGHPIGVGE